ncbi:hypothetical protein ACFLWR_00450 [Chloroflexota bacterium]
MVNSLTKEQTLECFKQRKSQFEEAIGKRLKPELPFTVETYSDLADKCSLVIMAFLETVYAEDKE